MALEQYAVRLTPDEREQLSRLIRSGKSSARIVARARILLKVDEGWNAPQVATALDVSKGTVYRAKRRYAEEGLAGVIQDRIQANRYRKLDDKGEAHPVSSTGQALIALACSPAPMATTTGPYICWPTEWWSWGWWSPCPMRRCG